jgi:hypothetical protein
MDFSTAASALRSLQRRELVPLETRSLGLELAAGPFSSDEALPGSASAAVAGVRTLLACPAWEGLAVGLLLARHCVDCPAVECPDALLEELYTVADAHLEHAEPRVRGLVASMLGSLARREGGGLAVYDRFFSRLSGSIASNFERTHTTITDRVSGDKEVAVDDTTGWKVGDSKRYIYLFSGHHTSLRESISANRAAGSAKGSAVMYTRARHIRLVAGEEAPSLALRSTA